MSSRPPAKPKVLKPGPGQAVAVFLLDRPEQAAGLVEVAVVGPGVQRCEALVAGGGTATAVGGAVGAGGVPRHANEQPAVVAIVGRPPILALGHQGGEIGFHRVEVELLEGLGIVEVFAERVFARRVLVQHAQVQLVRPPVAVRALAEVGRAVGNRAAAGFWIASVHLYLPFVDNRERHP